MRSTFRHRWGGYLALIVLVGLVGGLGLGSLAAARRTQSSFSVLLATTNPSDLQVSIYSGGVTNIDYRASLTREIARLPGVRHVAAGFVAIGAPLTRDGSPRIRVTGLAFPVASVNGLFFSQDRLVVNQGRLASPQRVRRDRDGAGRGQTPRVPRRPGDPVRVLLGCPAVAAWVRDQALCRRHCG